MNKEKQKERFEMKGNTNAKGYVHQPSFQQGIQQEKERCLRIISDWWDAEEYEENLSINELKQEINNDKV